MSNIKIFDFKLSCSPYFFFIHISYTMAPPSSMMVNIRCSSTANLMRLGKRCCKDQSLTQQTHCKTCHIGTAASRRVWLKCLVFYSTAHVDCWVQLDLCAYVLPCMDRVLTWCFYSNHKSSFWKKALIHLKVKVSFSPTSMPALQ